MLLLKLMHVVTGIASIVKIRVRWAFNRPQPLGNLNSDFLISITSYPPRFKFLRLTLLSLILENAERIPISVFLFKKDFESLNEKLLKLEPFGVSFFSIPEDWRVYLKLLPALHQFPEKCIITFDDDINYAGGYLSLLLEGSRLNPDAVVGHRGLIVPADPINSPYRSWDQVIGLEQSAISKLLLTGVGGVAYPKNFGNIINKSFDEANRYSPTADDLWFYYHEEAKNIRRVCLGNPLGEPKTWFGSQAKALWRLNVSKNFNDQTILILENLLANQYFGK